ncbi:hypothetical protein [Gordonia alkaliphila]|uniref:hypothetical protein n=1 Tax=Gordonia alkaliphila TaxID=1053547 RepID=UPI0031EE9501
MPLDQRITEGAAINCAFGRVFNPVLATSLVSIELNGYELVPVRWGRIEVPVLPGRYHFRVFIRNGPEIKHLAELDAEVVPGALLEMNYAFGGFGGPTLTVSATAEENRRALYLVLGGDGRRVGPAARLPVSRLVPADGGFCSGHDSVPAK